MLAQTIRVERGSQAPLLVARPDAAPCSLRAFRGTVIETFGDSVRVRPVRDIIVAPDAAPGCLKMDRGMTVARADLPAANTQRKEGSWTRTLGLLFGVYLGGALLAVAALSASGF